MDPCGSIDAFKHFTSPFYKSCCANGSWHWALRDFPSSTHRCFLRHSSSHQLLCQELWTSTVITWLGTKTSLHPMKSPRRWKYTFNMNKLEKGTNKSNKRQIATCAVHRQATNWNPSTAQKCIFVPPPKSQVLQKNRQKNPLAPLTSLHQCHDWMPALISQMMSPTETQRNLSLKTKSGISTHG